MSEISKQDGSKLLTKAVRWLCSPLVKLLVAKGIPYPQFRDMIKEIYIEQATQELQEKNEKASFSRIFVKTGVHRKEIKRIIEQVEDKVEDVEVKATLGGLLVSRWIGLPEFQDMQGRPKCLARISTKGEMGFSELIKSVSKDVHPRAILDEWLDLGVVTLEDNDRVCLNEAAFIPRTDFEEKAFFFGRNISDHIAACVDNLNGERDPQLERSVYFSSLSEATVSKLHKFARNKSIQLLEEINAEALKLKEQEKDQSFQKYRMRFGCYWFDEQTQPDEGDKK